MLMVTDAEVIANISYADVEPFIEAAFRGLWLTGSRNFPIARGTGSEKGHYFAAKSGYDSSTGYIGVKAGSYVPTNFSIGLPAHTSTTMLIDAATGVASAIVEANILNGMRTAAAGAIAARLLARTNSTVLGVIGAGEQAIAEIVALVDGWQFDAIHIYSRSDGRRDAVLTALEGRWAERVRFLDVETVVRSADILVTATPSREALFESNWVKPGTHVSAIGSDDVGKQELPVDLVARSKLVVDCAEQAAFIGESQHVIAGGFTTIEALGRQTLGALLCGAIPGRTSADEITVFDSSGVAVQDVAAAIAAICHIHPQSEIAQRHLTKGEMR
jgi:ornithine cyclodeaminase/alanine dehydrogenase-like protein (mu-crystallin family)